MTTIERLSRELCACRQELKEAMQQVDGLAEGKTQLAVSMYAKWERERLALEDEVRVLRTQKEDLEDQTRNLRYSLETSEQRCHHFE